jgi:hypothetical protein
MLHQEADLARAYLVSAQTGARLRAILREIDELYVVMINAQLVVGRAGQEAAGFEAISERLNALAREVGGCIRFANRHAADFCRAAFRTYQADRVRQSLLRLQRADAEGVAYQSSARETAWGRLHGEMGTAAESLGELFQRLDSIVQHMEAADHLALNARVEAVKARYYRDQFQAVADNIQRRAGLIRSVVEEIRPELEGLDIHGPWRSAS